LVNCLKFVKHERSKETVLGTFHSRKISPENFPKKIPPWKTHLGKFSLNNSLGKISTYISPSRKIIFGEIISLSPSNVAVEEKT